jgi:hypothetical protein
MGKPFLVVPLEVFARRKRRAISRQDQSYCQGFQWLVLAENMPPKLKADFPAL